MKVAYILLIPLLLVACEGPVGPVGEQGLMGIDGTDGIAGIDGIDGNNGTDGTDGVDGTDGQQGIQGEPGPGTRTVFNGAITSDDMNISFPNLSTNIQEIPIIDVWVCPSGFECLALPVTIEGVVTSTYFLGFNTLSIVNALSLLQLWASTGTYIIVMVE